jgi:hypothetical protein
MRRTTDFITKYATERTFKGAVRVETPRRISIACTFEEKQNLKNILKKEAKQE